MTQMTCLRCGGIADERGSYACGIDPQVKDTVLGRKIYWHDTEMPGPPTAWCVHVLSCECGWNVRQEGRFDPTYDPSRRAD